MRVLLAEDYDDARSLLQSLLEQDGWEVVAAKDGREALYLYHCSIHDEKYFDLLILDVEMPRLNGFAVGVNVRSLEKFSGGNIPRAAHIYLTGRDSELKVHSQDLIDSSFADDYVRKPINPDKFLIRIHDLVSRDKETADGMASQENQQQ